MVVLFEKVVNGVGTKLLLNPSNNSLCVMYGDRVISRCEDVCWGAINNEQWVYEFIIDCALEESGYIVNPEIDELKGLFS